MKVAIVQPEYSYNNADEERLFEKKLKLIDECDESLDIIVLPEYSQISTSGDHDHYHKYTEKQNDIILNKAVETAKRCSAIVFVNCAFNTEKSFINTTYAIDREGNIAGKYYKAHPAPSEVDESNTGAEVGYSYEFSTPCTVEIEGIKFGFLTCYDFYFYEYFAALARENVDVIIGCSHQRSDTHLALDIMGRFLSYNTNAYVIRSSVSLGADSPVGGSSMVVAPTGEMLVDMVNEVGIRAVEIDPHKRYLKPAGYHGALKPHHEYIEVGRRPWLYRPGGSFITVPFENVKNEPKPLCVRTMADIAKAYVADVKFVILAVDENLKIEDGTTLEKVFEKFSCHMNFYIEAKGRQEEIMSLARKYDLVKYVKIKGDVKKVQTEKPE